jgi:hypothetical protein
MSNITLVDTMTPDTQRKIEALERARDAQERREKVADALSAFISSADSAEIEALAVSLARDHRTLVQRKFGFFLAFAKVLARNYNESNYDARNEYACKTSMDIMNLTNGISGVPNV